MRILEIKQAKNCFDKNFTKDILFDNEVHENDLLNIPELGDITFYPFARTMYKITKPHHWNIKGIIGERTCRSIFSQKQTSQKIEKLKALFR